MVGVHAGKVAHGVAHIELNHADDTPENHILTSIHFEKKILVDLKIKDSLSVLLASIKGAGGKVLDKSDPLRDFHLSSLSLS